MINNSAKTIETLIRARYPLIYVVSFEEQRVLANLKKVTVTRNKKLLCWSITEGLETDDGSFLTELKDPLKMLEYIRQSDINGLFILRDFHHYLNDPVVVRKLRDAGQGLKTTMKNIVFLSPLLKVPTELEKEIAVVDYELPDKEELSEIVEQIAVSVASESSLEVKKNPELKNKIVEAALGLTAEEAENVFAKSLVEKGQFDIGIILSEKEQIIRKSGVLEYYHANEKMKEVGGLDELKKWLTKRGKSFSPKAREFG